MACRNSSVLMNWMATSPTGERLDSADQIRPYVLDDSCHTPMYGPLRAYHVQHSSAYCVSEGKADSLQDAVNHAR